MARARIEISRSALVENFRILSRQAPHVKMIAMVKANAYGHGAVFVAQSLRKEKSCHGFGVASFSEATELRDAFPDKKTRILVFSDCAPWSENLTQLCHSQHFEPVFSEVLSLLHFQASKRAREVPFHVEINTGMNRLGIPPESLGLIRLSPDSIFTHLADAENPRAPLTQKQVKTFHELCVSIKARHPRALLHFANSATLWQSRDYPLLQEMHLARPGLSLYGIRPIERGQNRGLVPVMRFLAPVVNRIFLKKGDQVGYGGTYTCTRASGQRVGIIASGYADGLFRSLSGRGIGFHGKKKLKLLGRVSMDLAAIELGPKTQIGDEIELWGPKVDPYLQAGLAETIPYEITTRIGERVERIYER